MEELYDLSDGLSLSGQKKSDDIELESLSLNDEYLEQAMKQLPYPILILEGLTSEEEFIYFRNRPYSDSTAVPLYCYVDEIITRVGMLDFTMDSLLAIRSMGNYRLLLMKDRETEVEVRLNDPDFLSKFIKL